MLKRLQIHHLILVDSEEIAFPPHFTVITGETGAGKTAILEAIKLTLGARVDSSVLRTGYEKGFTEITFSPPFSEPLITLLNEGGIPQEKEEDLIIRREISKEGRSRALINCRTVPLTLLQKIGQTLIDLIDQGSYQTLRSSESQRTLLDHYGNLSQAMLTFQAAYKKEKEVEKTVKELEFLLLRKEKEEELLAFQAEELENASLKLGEEELLFEQYQLLAKSQEARTHVDSLASGLSQLLHSLARLQKTAEALQSCSQTFSPCLSLLKEAFISIEESRQFLHCHEDAISHEPQTYQKLEKRLSAIAHLKRKYGKTIEEIHQFHQKIREELSLFSTLTEKIEILKTSLTHAKNQTSQAAEELTALRKQAALQFQEELTSQIQSLNIPQGKILIKTSPQQRTLSGDDEIHFWLQANPGEAPALVKEHASGGELSRLLLAIKVVLAEKNQTPTLIFDEIDANVGGQTATLIGNTLKHLGQYKQVLCITHFSQVATRADTHFCIHKEEHRGRTIAKIKLLDQENKATELLRMLGGSDGPKSAALKHLG